MSDVAPLFSVIMPAYNREKFIADALRSVMAQSFTDWECIVVDDGSTDGTCALVREIAAKEPRIQLIVQANAGPGAARNTGANAAKGKYLAFLDSDDLWLPWALETYREALEKARWPMMLQAAVDTRYGPEMAASLPKTSLQLQVYRDAIEGGANGHPPGAGMGIVLEADAFRRVGGFGPWRVNAEDYDLVMRMGTEPGFVAVVQPKTVCYRHHGAQESADCARSLAGLGDLFRREREGAYPGGRARARERRDILCAQIRPACVVWAQGGRFLDAWRLYCLSLIWQRRWRFAAGFPFFFMVQVVKKRWLHR